MNNFCTFQYSIHQDHVVVLLILRSERNMIEIRVDEKETLRVQHSDWMIYSSNLSLPPPCTSASIVKVLVITLLFTHSSWCRWLVQCCVQSQNSRFAQSSELGLLPGSVYKFARRITWNHRGRLSWCTVHTFQNSVHLGAHFLKYVQGTPFDVLNGFKWFSSVHH